MSKKNYVEEFSDRQNAPVELLTLEETAKIFRICRQTLSKLTKAGQIPHVRLGRKIFFNKALIEEFLSNKTSV